MSRLHFLRVRSQLRVSIVDIRSILMTGLMDSEAGLASRLARDGRSGGGSRQLVALEGSWAVQEFRQCGH